MRVRFYQRQLPVAYFSDWQKCTQSLWCVKREFLDLVSGIDLTKTWAFRFHGAAKGLPAAQQFRAAMRSWVNCVALGNRRRLLDFRYAPFATEVVRQCNMSRRAISVLMALAANAIGVESPSLT